MRNFIYPITIICVSIGSPIYAQSDDRSYLTALLEDNLSGEGRKVTITGFTGALSSRATIENLTISDDKGDWLTLEKVVLDWNRAALFSGALLINELSAQNIVLERLPQSEEEPSTLEAQPYQFALPELPLSIDIKKIAAPNITLGPAILGEKFSGTLLANLHLEGGNGRAELDLKRTDADAPEGTILLSTSYENATETLSLNLNIAEGAGGLAAKALDLPDLPSTELSLNGKGTLDNFAALFALKTDGVNRLAGPITLTSSEAGEQQFIVAFEGDPAPLFLPEYADFLGRDLDFTVSGRRLPEGEIYIDGLTLSSEALNLVGRLQLAQDGLPELIELNGSIANKNGTEVLLPIPGDVQTRISRADLNLGFDAKKNNTWSATAAIQGLNRSDLKSQSMVLIGVGQIDRLADSAQVSGNLNLQINELSELQPALAEALGTNLHAQTSFTWKSDEPRFSLPSLSLRSDTANLGGEIAIEDWSQNLKIVGKASLNSPDLSRFAKLAQQNLSGAGQVKLSGTFEPLNGHFDVETTVDGEKLGIGISEVDQLLSGQSTVELNVSRDQTGIEISKFHAQAATLKLEAKGNLRSQNSELTGNIEFSNLAALGPKYQGKLNTDFKLSGAIDNATVEIKGMAQDLGIGQADADKLIAGTTNLDTVVHYTNEIVRIEHLKLNGQQISANIAQKDNSADFNIEAQLNNLGLVLPQFNGPVRLSGTMRPEGETAHIDVQLSGPAALRAHLQGRVDGNRPNLRVNGTANAAVVNPFVTPITANGDLSYDLTLNGGWASQNLNGQMNWKNGRVSLPARELNLQNIDASVGIAANTATVDIRANNGNNAGRLTLSGTSQLAAPYAADLIVKLQNLRLRDPELYSTVLNSEGIKLTGPLLGQAKLDGVVMIGHTELQVPSTGFASGADLAAIAHKNDSSAVKLTRRYAGIDSQGTSSSSQSSLPNWLINLKFIAANQVFIRGRGLDAELGGEIAIAGTLRAIIPSGGFELIRGRLDVLGKRLTLNTASLLLEGDFIPSLDVSASNVSGNVTSFINISGRADDPQITFTSEPSMPQEEVVAWLLFGRGLASISAFQAAQLATAVATLAGSGGGGIMGKVRKSLGVDDFDVQTSEDGTTSISAGAYLLKDKVYSEIGVDQNGNTRINLNYDVKQNLTVKGRMDSNGQSGIGIYLQKDY